MESPAQYNYEDSMLNLNDILDQILNALENCEPLSLGRYGHGEIAFLGHIDFHDAHYAGATASASTISEDLLEALRTTDIIGFHASWSDSEDDRSAAEMTKKLLLNFGLEPTNVCSAFLTYEMIKSERFWECLRNRRVALVGRRAEEACPAFVDKGVDIVYTAGFEGYEDIERVYGELSKRADWDVALLSAGIPATILAPRLANQTKRVVIDFGHALDRLIDGENFDYWKLVREWEERAREK